MWIRSQDNESLTNCDRLFIMKANKRNEYGIYDISDLLGKYKSKKRCLEILNKIQNTIAFVLVGEKVNPIYSMPKK